MEIKNVTQFVTFIGSKNLTNKDSNLLELVKCLNNYTAACNCHKSGDKQELYNTCNRMYLSAVRNIIPKFKGELLPTIPERQISFYTDNGSLIMRLTL